MGRHWNHGILILFNGQYFIPCFVMWIVFMQMQRVCALSSTDIGTVICGQRFWFYLHDLWVHKKHVRTSFSEASSCLFNQGRGEWRKYVLIVVVWSFCGCFSLWKALFWQKWNAICKTSTKKDYCILRQKWPISAEVLIPSERSSFLLLSLLFYLFFFPFRFPLPFGATDYS